MKNLSLFFILSFYTISIFAQNISTITEENILKHITYLASDSLKGRKPGTKESGLAAEYIRKQFLDSKLKPLAENGFQNFEIVTDIDLGKNNQLLFNDFKGKISKDFTPIAFTANTNVNAEIVFVGYGFDFDQDSVSRHDYQGLNVQNKWVMILNGDPDYDNVKSPYFSYSSDRLKVVTAKDKGAAGVIFVNGVNISKNDNLFVLQFDNSLSNAGIAVINIKRSVADKILSTVKEPKKIDLLEKEIIKTKKTISIEIPTKLQATTDVVQTKSITQNVVALLEGNDPVLKNEYIVIGAHYDHLGMGGPGSNSRMPERIDVHNGADDNASGVAAVIELAKYLSNSNTKLKRSIIFTAFAAEEMGLLGSKYFTTNCPVNLKQIKAMLNFDMIGRLDSTNKTLGIGGTGTALEFDSLLKKCQNKEALNLSLVPDGSGPSDHAAFYSENISVLYFLAGTNSDYHTPFDDVEKININGEKRIIEYVAKVVTEISNNQPIISFKESGAKHSSRSGRSRMKVSLGIIPEATGIEKRGVKIEGVNKDGVADKAGLLKGDIITAINQQKIENIYDYMSKLGKFKHGDTVEIEVLRNDEKKILKAQL